MAKQLKFYSPDGTDIRVCMPDGRVAIVGEVPRPLHPSMNRAAAKAGCLTTDMPSAAVMAGPSVPPADDAFARRVLIKDKILEAARSAEDEPGFEDAFTAAGVPNIKWLNTALGFNIERSERDELWAEVQAELDAGEAEAPDVE